MTKLLTWEKLTGGKVSFDSDITLSNVVFNRKYVNKNVTEKSAVKILSCMKQNPNITIPELCEITGFSDRGVRNNIEKLKQSGQIVRICPDKGGHWKVVEN